MLCQITLTPPTLECSMCKKLAHSSCPLPGVPYCFPYNSNKRRASCVSNNNNTSSMYDQNHWYNFYICTECIKNNKTTNNKTVSSVGAPGSKGTSIGGNAEMTSISTSAASRTSAAIGRSASNNKATSIHITSARSSNTSGTRFRLRHLLKRIPVINFFSS